MGISLLLKRDDVFYSVSPECSGVFSQVAIGIQCLFLFLDNLDLPFGLNSIPVFICDSVPCTNFDLLPVPPFTSFSKVFDRVVIYEPRRKRQAVVKGQTEPSTQSSRRT